jgi:hypothetical protein
MLHGREYSKRIVGVKPPNGSSVWTSGLPDQGVCLAAAPIVAHRGSQRVQDLDDTPPNLASSARSRPARAPPSWPRPCERCARSWRRNQLEALQGAGDASSLQQDAQVPQPAASPSMAAYEDGMPSLCAAIPATASDSPQVARSPPDSMLHTLA